MTTTSSFRSAFEELAFSLLVMTTSVSTSTWQLRRMLARQAIVYQTLVLVRRPLQNRYELLFGPSRGAGSNRPPFDRARRLARHVCQLLVHLRGSGRLFCGVSSESREMVVNRRGLRDLRAAIGLRQGDVFARRRRVASRQRQEVLLQRLVFRRYGRLRCKRFQFFFCGLCRSLSSLEPGSLTRCVCACPCRELLVVRRELPRGRRRLCVEVC